MGDIKSVFPNTPLLNCIAMDKLFKLKKKKKARIVPFWKDVRVYIYI